MDPNTTLQRIREALAAYKRTTNPDAAGAVAQDAIEAIQDLDTWLSKGGALPKAWEKGRNGKAR